MSYVGFNKLKGQLAHRSGVTNPGALAAYIGRKKYGDEAMRDASRTGKSLRGHKTKKSRRRDNLEAFTRGSR